MGQGSSYADTVNRGEIINDGSGNGSQEPTSGHSRQCRPSPGCRFWESLKQQLTCPTATRGEGYIHFDSKSGFKLTSSFFVPSKLFSWKDDLEGKQRQTLKCLALSSCTGIFHAFLKGRAHSLARTPGTHSVKIDF